jgi:hypothetical protein
MKTAFTRRIPRRHSIRTNGFNSTAMKIDTASSNIVARRRQASSARTSTTRPASST